MQVHGVAPDVQQAQLWQATELASQRMCASQTIVRHIEGQKLLQCMRALPPSRAMLCIACNRTGASLRNA